MDKRTEKMNNRDELKARDKIVSTFTSKLKYKLYKYQFVADD